MSSRTTSKFVAAAIASAGLAIGVGPAAALPAVPAPPATPKLPSAPPLPAPVPAPPQAPSVPRLPVAPPVQAPAPPSVPAAPSLPAPPSGSTGGGGSSGGGGGSQGFSGGGGSTGGSATGFSGSDGGSGAPGVSGGSFNGVSTLGPGGGAVARTPKARRRAERRFRRSVKRLSSCLDTLPTFQRRVLVLRTGVGSADPTSRRRVARRLGANVRTVGRAERNGLVTLRRTSRKGGCGGSSGNLTPGDFRSFLPLAFSMPVPAIAQLASLPSGDAADPNFDPSPSAPVTLPATSATGDGGKVLSFNESSPPGDYSGLDSGLKTDDGLPAADGAKRTAAATSDGGLLPLPVILLVLLFVLAGVAAYAILGRTRRRRSAGGPDQGPGVTLAAATAVAAPSRTPERVAPPVESAPQPGPVEPEPRVEPEVDRSTAEPAPWLADDVFNDLDGAQADATPEDKAPVPAAESVAAPETDEEPTHEAPEVREAPPVEPAPALSPEGASVAGTGGVAAGTAGTGRRRQGGLVGKVAKSSPVRRALGSRRRNR